MTKFAVSPKGAECFSCLAQILIKESRSIIDSSERLKREIATHSEDLGIYSDAIIAVASRSKKTLIQNKQDIENLAFLLQKKADEIRTLCSRIETPSAKTPTISASSDAYRKTNVPIKSRPESKYSRKKELTRTIGFLPQTGQKIFALDNGNTLFNTPQTTGAHLNYNQGHAVSNFEGTCGLVSCENVARLAGKDVTEADAVRLASKKNWCTKKSSFSSDNGGTNAEEREKILNALGINSTLDYDLSINHIANEIESGKGIIASVAVNRFWQNCPDRGLHAITITSVERDSFGNPVAFYVCDSGSIQDDYARRISSDDLQRALSGNPLNVTCGAIR